MSEDQFQTLRQMIDSMQSRMETGFARVDQRFEQVDQRFEKIEGRLADLDKDIMRVDAVLATKAGNATVYASMFALIVGTVSIVAGSIVIANILGQMN